jgi:hypothetical protein
MPLQYEAPPLENPMVSQHAVELLRQMGVWIRIFAVLLFGVGGLMLLCGPLMAVGGMLGATFAPGRSGSAQSLILGLVYFVVGALYIVPGIFLWQSATRAKAFSLLKDIRDLEGALQAQKSFWKFVTIMVLIVIGLYALLIPVAIVMTVMGSRP